MSPLPPPTRPVHPSAGSRSPAFARDFTSRHRLAHLGRCIRSWLRRSRRWCRPPLFALRSTTAAQTTAALQTDPPAASRGGPPQSVNVVSGLSRTATRRPTPELSTLTTRGLVDSRNLDSSAPGLIDSRTQTMSPLPPPTRPVHPSAGSRSPAFARDFTSCHRLAHLGRCIRSWLRRLRRWCRPPLFALRSTTAAQTTAALQTDPPAASRGGPPQSVNVVSGLSRTATRGLSKSAARTF